MSVIIAVDGLFRNLCDIGEKFSDNNQMHSFYYIIMLFSISYNTLMVNYGIFEIKQASLRWENNFKDEY